MSEEVFTYVIARPWYPDNPESSLCIYAYGTEIHTGTMEDAMALLEYVRFSSRNEPEKKYSIYRVDFQKLDDIA